MTTRELKTKAKQLQREVTKLKHDLVTSKIISRQFELDKLMLEQALKLIQD